MADFTDGPWIRDSRHPDCIRSQSGTIIAVVDNANQDANAHLIIAAPEFHRAALLRREYEALPADRGGKHGPKGKARAAWEAAEELAFDIAEGRTC